jgi:formate--tetrahydrofolate ligase
VTSAHNLLAAVIDNALHHRDRRIDPRRVLWKRVLDVNDRSLREIVLGLGGHADGVPRQSGFDITAASEVMAMLCLASGPEDLRRRLDRTIVARDYDGKPVTIKDLQATGAMLALLKDALLPNLVQTVDGVPAIVHGGPFANIAHGCSSVIATKTALALADWVVTEAGFAFDLGGEKFYDIKCRSAGLDTAAVVLVATVRALRMHGEGRVEAGLSNLAKHLESVRMFGETPIVALNRFADDTELDIDVVRRFCAGEDVPFAVCDAFARGGDGGVDVAQAVVTHAEPQSSPFLPLYPLDLAPVEKIRTIARTMYGARDIVVSPEAERDLARIRAWGLDHLPVCMAKTQHSLSDDPHLRGRPEGFDLRVRRLEIAAGAGFLVVLTGEIVRMPGLPEQSRVGQIDVVGGKIVGLV